MLRRFPRLLPLCFAFLSSPVAAAPDRGGAVLHEPILPDAREDVALAISLDGDFPAAIDTPRGPVAAPDGARPIGPNDRSYDQLPGSQADMSFHPDRNTRRPDQLPYDEPFSPSIAPFKRLSAFDAVDASYTLSVRDTTFSALPISAQPALGEKEERFYADLVVDLVAGQKIRIPSVGPGARVLRARGAIGADEVRFKLWRDGAENWYVESESTKRVRMVMDVAIARAAFGGDYGNPSWSELLPVPGLPVRVDRAAKEVSARIGVSRRQSPRENITKLVAYFRSFVESEEPPASSRDIYLDLALSRKGVCRHRAFAFMVTALHLGLPTRMVVNEAHAWVEVHDGHQWRRIDLGGAGRMLSDPLSTNVLHDPPPDPYAWPQGATRGDDLASLARQANGSPLNPPGAASHQTGGGTPQFSAGPSGAAAPAGSLAAAGVQGSSNAGTVANSSALDARPASRVMLSIEGADARRGTPFALRGKVLAEETPCPNVMVDIVLHNRAEPHTSLRVGQLATDDQGAYEGVIVVPASLPLGDYDVRANTLGDGRCGAGSSR